MKTFRVEHSNITSLDINRLLNAIKNHVGLSFGFHPEFMNDIYISSFYCTCDINLSIKRAENLRYFVIGWFAGANIPMYQFIFI